MMHCRVLRVVCWLGCGAALGCSSRTGAVSLHEPVARSGANLVFGGAPGLAEMAQSYGRNDWPITIHGYRDEDVTFYGSFQYDQQYYFDDQNALMVGTQAYRTGTFTQ